MKTLSIKLTLIIICLGTFIGCNSKVSQGSLPIDHQKAKTPPKQNKKLSAHFEIGLLFWSQTILGQVAMKNGLEREFENINSNRRKLNYPALKARSYIAGDGPEGTKRQMSQMKELLKEPPDLIIVQPTDTHSLTDLLKVANQKQIHVISYDQYIQGAEQLSFITSNNFQAGYLDGEYIDSHYDDHYEIKLILVEYPQVSSTVSRVNGLLQALDIGKQRYKILKNYSAVDPKSGAIAAIEILKDFPLKNSIDVIFSVNDGGGLAIVDAFVKIGRKEVFFASVDGDPKSVENIKEGITKVDSAQFCSELGAESMRTAYKYLSGQKVAKEIFLPVFPITKETIHLYNGWQGEIPKQFIKPWHKKTEALWLPTILTKN